MLTQRTPVHQSPFIDEFQGGNHDYATKVRDWAFFSTGTDPRENLPIAWIFRSIAFVRPGAIQNVAIYLLWLSHHRSHHEPRVIRMLLPQQWQRIRMCGLRIPRSIHAGTSGLHARKDLG